MSFITNKSLPKTWEMTSLTQLLAKLESGSRPKGGVKDIKEGIPSIGGEHLDSNGGFKFEKIKFVPEEFAEKMKRGQIQRGDILIVKDGATTSKTSLVRDSFPFDQAVVNEHVFICRCNDSTDAKYVFYFLFSAEGKAQILKDFRGAAQGGISQKFVEKVIVPLAPEEQRKEIVAEIEKQFSRLDEAVTSLMRAKANLKRYKAAVLKTAVEGKLTEEWRKQHPDVEPASELLNRIFVERGEKGAESDRKDLYSLPKTWKWVKLKDVFDVITDGDHQAPPKSKFGVPFLVIGNVSQGKIDLSKTRFVSQAYYDSIKKTRKPQRGDLLYTVVGSYGIPVKVEIDSHFCVQRHIAILKPNQLISRDYLYYALATLFVYKQATQVATGTAQKTVSLGGLRNINIPLPSFDEQKQIVLELDKHLSALTQLQKIIKSAQLRSVLFQRAILEDAFTGSLHAN